MNGHSHEELLAALQLAVNRDLRRRRHRLSATVTATMFSLLIGGTVASAGPTPWATRSKPERSKAVILVQAKLRYDYDRISADSVVAVWRAPDSAGGNCLLLGALNGGVPMRAGVCESGGIKPVYSRAKPIELILSTLLSHGRYDHILLGSVDRRSGIVKVVLQRPANRRTLAFSHGWFLGDTGPTTTVGIRTAYIIGYDRSGDEVARVRVSGG